MMALVQIRERKERRQQHDLETLPVCDVKPWDWLSGHNTGRGVGLHLPVQVIV